VTSFEKAEQAKAYQKAVEDFQTNLPEDEQKDFKEARFAPFLVAADGDWDAAYEGYKQWVTDFKAEYGAPPTAAGDQPAAGHTAGSARVRHGARHRAARAEELRTATSTQRSPTSSTSSCAARAVHKREAPSPVGST
jgi:hypothetical protein